MAGKHASAHPSGATFLVSHREIVSLSSGTLSFALGDGQDYDVESVLDETWQMVEQRARRE